MVIFTSNNPKSPEFVYYYPFTVQSLRSPNLALTESGAGNGYGINFLVNGAVSPVPVPVPEEWAMMLLGLSLVGSFVNNHPYL